MPGTFFNWKESLFLKKEKKLPLILPWQNNSHFALMHSNPCPERKYFLNSPLHSIRTIFVISLKALAWLAA